MVNPTQVSLYSTQGIVPSDTPIISNRAPTVNDVNYPLGKLWIDTAGNAAYILSSFSSSGGTLQASWLSGGNEDATTTTMGLVRLNEDLNLGATNATVPTSLAAKNYIDGVAIAGAPVSTEVVAGIGQLATDAEAIAGTASTPGLALFVTPSNLSPVFAEPPSIGGITPASGSFTTLASSGLLTASASATIDTGGTALNLATDNSGDDVNIGLGTTARDIHIGDSAAAHTLTIGSTTGASAVTIQSGTGSINLASTGTGDIIIDSDDTLLLDSDGVLELNSSAAAISIGNDADAFAINIGTGAAARTITIGNSTGATALSLQSGTGNIDIGTDAVAHTITLGNSTGATSVVIACGTGALNIGTNAIAHTVTIGNVTGASAVNINVGTGNFALNGVGASTYNIGAATTTGTVSIGGTSQTGTLTIGPSDGTMTLALANANGTKTINMGNGINGNTISIGNGINTSAQTINISSGNSAANSTVNILAGNATAGTQTLNLATGTGGKTVEIATGAGPNDVFIGSIDTTSSTTINAGSGGIIATTNTEIQGNLTLSGTNAIITLPGGGSVSDSLASAVLIAGTTTVNNTNTLFGDKIFALHSDLNGSTAIGTLQVTLNPGVSFTINSLDATGAVETNDVSAVNYIIFRPL